MMQIQSNKYKTVQAGGVNGTKVFIKLYKWNVHKLLFIEAKR